MKSFSENYYHKKELLLNFLLSTCKTIKVMKVIKRWIKWLISDLISTLHLDLSELKEVFKEEEIQQIMQKSKSRITHASESQSVNSEIIRRNSEISNIKPDDSSATKNVDSEDAAQVGDTLIESESAAVGSVGFDVYLRYFKSIGALLIAFVLIFTLSSEASSVMSNCMKNLVDNASLG